MKKDLQKVASDLNAQLLNGLFKQAAKDDKKEERKALTEDQLNQRRSWNRIAERLMPWLRTATFAAGGGLATRSLKGAILGGALGAGVEGISGAIGKSLAHYKGGTTGKERMEYSSTEPWKNWKHLLPGYGQYQRENEKITRQNALDNLIIQQSVERAKQKLADTAAATPVVVG